MPPKPSWRTLQEVNDLVNQEGAGWNIDTLNQLFIEIKIQSIKRILINSLDQPDRLIWQASKNGQYTVKSGYKCAKLYGKQVKGR